MPITSADCHAHVHKVHEASSVLLLEYTACTSFRMAQVVHGRGEISPPQEGVECRI